ncbi:restriction endonuclease [Methanospirillum hungatei]|uniref:restriction endonuclease n=1 Tax=Methanospirillum hungatei TaxID=2203 RepID=UPI0026F1A0BE|nr:restriction endonuclease [Methanospirillum hungatei]MCA1916049.1 restriction endonuclease [Methanospirillum hungatei]
MNVLDAVHEILIQAGEPLHYSEITRRMLDKKLRTTQGKNPEHTVMKQLDADINKKNSSSRFERSGPGIYGLKEFSQSKPEQGEPSILSFGDAAEQILRDEAHGQPIHYREITKRALDLGLIRTQGLTPENTMYGQIFNEIKRNKSRGDIPRFEMMGKGFISLSEWHDKGLAFEIEKHNNETKKLLHERLLQMSPTSFEVLIGNFLTALGFESVSVTKPSADGGIDVRGILVVGDVIKTRLAVQVKRWKGNVQAPIVQQVRGSLGAHEQGLIITTSDFSPGAREEAERADATPVGLMNGEQLVDLLIENNIGVKRTDYALIDMPDDEESGLL